MKQKKVKIAIALLLIFSMMVSLVPISDNRAIAAETSDVDIIAVDTLVNGDANGDEKVDACDLARIVKKLDDADEVLYEGGDVNEDQLVQDNDRREIIDILQGREVDIRWYEQDENATVFNMYTRAELAGFLQLTGSAKTHNFRGDTINLQNKITVNRGDKESWGDTAINLDDYRGSGFPNNPTFCGTFDGKGYTLSGMYIHSTEANSMRGANLFVHTGDGTLIQNLKIENSLVQSDKDRHASALVGLVNGSTTIKGVEIADNVTVSGAVNEAGGLVANCQSTLVVEDVTVKSSVSNSTASSQVHAAGQIVGSYNSNNGSLTMSKVRTAGSVKAANAGGLIGVIRECVTAFNYTLKDVAVATTIDDSSSNTGDIIGGRVNTDACTITDDFDTVYRLDANADGTADYALLGESTYFTLSNNGESVRTVSDVSEMSDRITGYDDTYKDAGLVTEALPTPDISWYTANPTATAFTLQDKADFLGFLSILWRTTTDTTAKAETFSGDTVTLATDIVFNQGDVSEWYVEEDGFIVLKDENVTMPTTSFSGTFDGDYHTIAGIYMEDTTEGSGWAGLFPYTAAGAAIKNLNVTNSYFKGYRYTGGLIAQHQGGKGVTITNVNVDAEVVSTNTEAGGLVGASTGKVMVNNSIIDCNVTCTNPNQNGSAGGVVGRMMAESSSGRGITLENTRVLGTVTCATNDTVQLGHAGGIVGCLRNKAQDITWQITLTKVGLGNAVAGACADTTGLLVGGASQESENALKITNSITNLYVSSENNEKALYGETTYLQPSTTASYSSLSVDEMAIKVSPYEANTAWYDESASTYSLWTKEQFLGFMQMANNTATDGTTFSEKTIRLERDMTFNQRVSSEWATNRSDVVNTFSYMQGAANNGNMFSGTFDGCGHILSGLCVYTVSGINKGAGLFLSAGSGATIKNLEICNSVMENMHGTGRYAGSLSGYTSGGLTVENVQVQADVKAGSGDVGGLVGKTDGTLTVKNSTFDCNVTDSAYHVNTVRYAGAGGLIGCADGSRVYSFENVKVAGSVNGASHAGGILGKRRTSSMKLTMKNVVITSEIQILADTSATTTYRGLLIGSCNYNTKGTITDSFSGVYALCGDAVNKGVNTFGSDGSVLSNYGMELIAGLQDVDIAAQKELKVISYNVLGIEQTGYDSLETRAGRIASWIQSSGADIVAVQEAGCDVKTDANGSAMSTDGVWEAGYDMTDTFANLVTTSSNYKAFQARDIEEFETKVQACVATANSGTYPENYWPNALGLTIFYNAERFEVIAQGVEPYAVSLRGTVLEGDSTECLPAAQLRCYQWMNLKDLWTGKNVYVTNTHWSVDSDGYETNSVTTTGEQLRQLEASSLLAAWDAHRNDAIIIGIGDYNCNLQGTCHLLVSNNSYAVANENGIDHVFYDTASLRMKQFNCEEYTDAVKNSDHLPIVMTGAIKE